MWDLPGRAGGGRWGKAGEGVYGPKCPLRPRGPHIWSRGRRGVRGHAQGRGAPAWPPPPPGRAAPRWPPAPIPLPGALPPTPPDKLYIAIFPRTHTRDPRGTEETPKKGKKPHSNRCQKKAKPNRGGEGAAGGGLAQPRGGTGGAGWGWGGGPGPAATRSLLVLELVGEPVEALVEPVPAGGTGGLDVPVTVAQGVQPQLVRDLRRVHGIGQVLGQRWGDNPASRPRGWVPRRRGGPTVAPMPWGQALSCHGGWQPALMLRGEARACRGDGRRRPRCHGDGHSPARGGVKDQP